MNNSGEPYKIIAEGNLLEENILYPKIWSDLKHKYNEQK